ncbi:hypothetical protein DFO55_12054 [Grimontella sp. AG753]|nr:hypothetical protein DFO55_12054 [Grimontella sp. AG753]
MHCLTDIYHILYNQDVQKKVRDSQVSILGMAASAEATLNFLTLRGNICPLTTEEHVLLS